MKKMQSALAIIVLAGAASAAAAAPRHVVTVDRDTMASGLIGVNRIDREMIRPGFAAFGTVMDPSAAIAAREGVVRAEAAARLASATLARTATLYRRAHNVSKAAVETARAGMVESKARLQRAERVARARFGPALGGAIIAGGHAWQRIAGGASLVMVVHPGAALPMAPRTATGHEPDGASVALRAVGAAGRVPPGLVGQGFYFTGPPLAAGTALDVSITGGTAVTGYAVPLSALIYRGDAAYAFMATGVLHFVEVTVPQDRPVRRKGAVVAWFVPAARLGGGGSVRVVTRGAGLMRSIAAGAHGPVAGADHD